MLGIRYIKNKPTIYAIHYKNGKIKREGSGLSFFYYAPTSTVVLVPISSADVPFIFQEITNDYQPITIQGKISYRVSNPKNIASLLDFSINHNGEYSTDDPDVLRERLVFTTQILTRSITQEMKMRDALTGLDSISPQVLKKLKDSESIKMLGIEVLDISILSIRPTPEMAKALEAETREATQKKADEAVYSRRNAAVEQERTIKENELKTEIAVEEKKRTIRETKMSADIAVEEQRSTLISSRVENDRKEADSRAYMLETTLKPIRATDWRALMSLSSGNADPAKIMAMAFQELSANAQKIGELNISPDLLNTIIKRTEK